MIDDDVKDHLRQFLRDATPNYIPIPEGDEGVRKALLFAARCIQSGDLTLPRNLRAWQLIQMVSEEDGAELFRDYVGDE